MNQYLAEAVFLHRLANRAHRFHLPDRHCRPVAETRLCIGTNGRSGLPGERRRERPEGAQAVGAEVRRSSSRS